MPQRPRRAIAPELPLGEQFELLMVGVAGDGARRADAAALVAGVAEVDGLTDVAKRVGALGELVREREGGLLKEVGLGLEDRREGRGVGHGGL